MFGKILHLYFRGKFRFLGEIFQLGELLNLCFKGKFYFKAAFSVLAILCMENLKSLFWG